MSELKRTLIACSMMEDEVNNALHTYSGSLNVIWMDRGHHKYPDTLREKLQEQIDQLQDQDELLLAYGLCGNGTTGLVSPNTRLIIPRFDDCINMLLCTGKRTSRGLTKADTLYITNGWANDDDEAVLMQYEKLIEQYDEEMALVVMETMFEHYNYVSALDTGCYDVTALMDYLEKVHDLLDLEITTTPGNNHLLKQLLSGEYDDNFIVLSPGEVLTADHFAFPVKRSSEQFTFQK